MNVSARLNAMFVDPNRENEAFWKLLQSYVRTVANGLVANALIEDLTSDVLFQILVSLDKFSHQPEHNGSSFTRWVSGVCFRRAANLKRDFYGAREIPASNFGTYIDGDKWQPADLSALAPSLTDEEFEDSLSTELWPALVQATLKRTRASLPARDVALFDAIRKSGQVKMSAKEAGVNSATAYHRVRGWSELADNPGTRPSPKQSTPSSSRPDERLAIACIQKNAAALLIRESWRFSSQRTVVMPAEQYDEIADRGYTTFSV